jgi:nickel/cobalt exporter
VKLTYALLGAAVSIAVVHACAPDHWMPFAALARAERWSTRRTAAITAVCGFGHVSASVLLGLVALLFGRELVERFGHRLESLSGLLLIGFGTAYALWGLRSAVVTPAGHHHHHHHHGRGHADAHSHTHAATDRNAPRRSTAVTLFLLFAADPCVAVIPLMFAAAALGWGSVLAVVAAYEAATLATMVLLVLPARAAAGSLRIAWADRYGSAVAGSVVAVVGIAVIVLGV